MDGMYAVNNHIFTVLSINEKNEVYVSNPNGKERGWQNIDTLFEGNHFNYMILVKK